MIIARDFHFFKNPCWHLRQRSGYVACLDGGARVGTRSGHRRLRMLANPVGTLRTEIEEGGVSKLVTLSMAWWAERRRLS